MEGTNNSDKLSKFNLNEITKTTPEKIDEIIDKNESIDSIDNNSENLDFLQNMLSRTKSLDFNQNNQETLTPRKTILSNLARCSNIMKNFTVEELEITIDKIHLKAEDEKTEKEKELEVLEQIGMNCIYSRDSFKNINFTEKQIKYKEFHNKIIIGNLNWIKKKKEEDEDFFNKLSKPQKPKYLVIACSDSRVVVNEFTATEPGDVFTHRNIGNLIISTDFNCQSVLQFAVDYLKVEHILVIGHTDCGAIRAALSYDHHGLIDHWLKNIREVAEKHKQELENCPEKDHESRVRSLIELNIREQCLNLCKSPTIQQAWARGQDLYIHGYIFEMNTGMLKDLSVVQNDWSNIQEIYKYSFKP